MTKQEALNQLCKMMDEVALNMELESPCICGESSYSDSANIVMDHIITNMWAAIYYYNSRKKVK